MTKFDIWYLLIIIDLFTIIFLIYTTDLSYTKNNPNKSMHKPYPSSTQYSNWKKKIITSQNESRNKKKTQFNLSSHFYF